MSGAWIAPLAGGLTRRCCRRRGLWKRLARCARRPRPVGRLAHLPHLEHQRSSRAAAPGGAAIELRQGATVARKTDLGFVPLLHVAGEARLAAGWRFSLDADALAGGPGRAADLALKLGRDIGTHWRVAAGYRTVEGGADVPAVYSFAWLHYAVLSVARSF
jgi:hypothetical protein